MIREPSPEGCVTVRERAPGEDDDVAALQEAITESAYTGLPVWIDRTLVLALKHGQSVKLRVPYAQ